MKILQAQGTTVLEYVASLDLRWAIALRLLEDGLEGPVGRNRNH